MSEIKPIRNYPFRGKIYTAKQVDEIISNVDPDLSNYYDKSEIDTIIDNVDSAIDAKQDTLIAGDNISIVDNVISAIVSGSDSIKLIPKTWQNVIDDTEINFYLIKAIQNNTEYIIIIKNNDGTYASCYPICASNGNEFSICGAKFNKNYGISYLNTYGTQTFQISRSSISLYKEDGTIIDVSNIDNFYSTNHFTINTIMEIKTGYDRSNFTILSGQERITFFNGNGIYKTTISTIYDAIKNDNSLSTGGSFLSVSNKSIATANIVNVYKVELPINE